MIGNSGGAGKEDGVTGSNGGGLKKGPWSSAEDAVLIDYVKKHGEGNWNAVQRNTALQRCGKSCRLRWANHLRPNLKKGAFSSDEERLILHLHSKLGNKWARISAHLPGRTDNEVKNYWNTRVKRRIRQGLPLYTDDNSNQPPSLPLKTPSNSNPINSLPLLHPVSLSSVFPLRNSPPFPSSYPIKNPNSFLGRPVLSPSQMGHPQINQIRFGFDSGLAQMETGDLGIMDFELPSNQYNSQRVAENVDPEKGVKSNENSGRVNGGLLGDLLQEAQSMVRDISSSENSSTEINSVIKNKESEERQLNEGLSRILELIPSLVQAPSWCDESSGRESSVGQSSVISTDHNRNGLDQPPQRPSFPSVITTDYDGDDGYWNPSNGCTWDNLPSIF